MRVEEHKAMEKRVRPITKEMVDAVTWDAYSIFRGGGRALIGCYVDTDGSVLFKDEDGQFREYHWLAKEWAPEDKED